MIFTQKKSQIIKWDKAIQDIIESHLYILTTDNQF